MTDFFELYDALIEGISSDAVVTDTLMGECWTAVETNRHFGMAMTTPVDTAPRMIYRDYTGMGPHRSRIWYGCCECLLQYSGAAGHTECL